MNIYLRKNKSNFLYRCVSLVVAITFVFSSVIPPSYAQLIPQSALNLPAPGAMLPLSTGFTPALIKGITIHPENPLEFDFIVNKGDGELSDTELREDAYRMIKYFLASLTVPEEEQWVNLSPYEQNRIIPDSLGQTEMGRDLLTQDYLLKQLTASLIYPEDELGQKFWNRVYTKVQKQFGTTEIPMNTFNKVWIVPEKAVIYEHDNTAFVVSSHLKVMLQEDYMALEANKNNSALGLNNGSIKGREAAVSGVSSDAVREVLIPEIEIEINEGENFANLRQVYNSMILATWFKMNLKESLLGQVYVDQNKIVGIDLQDKNVKQEIYNKYIEAFSHGVYNYIREEYDPTAKETIPRKYFSGGTAAVSSAMLTVVSNPNELSSEQRAAVSSPLEDETFNVEVLVSEIGTRAPNASVALAVEGAEIASLASSPVTALQKEIAILQLEAEENPTTHARARVVEAQRKRVRFEEGRYIEYVQTPMDIAGSQAPIQNDLRVTNHVGREYNRTQRRHFRNREATKSYGVTNQVSADALVRAKKLLITEITNQHLTEILGLKASTDDVQRLRADLVKNGYLDDSGLVTEKFIDLDPTSMELDGEYGIHMARIYLGIINVIWKRIQSIYQGGWAEIMKYFGASDQAKAPTNYLSMQPAEMSNFLIQHARHQEAAIRMMELTEEQELFFRASPEFVNFYIPIMMDIDHGHGQPQQIIHVNLTVGRDGLLVAAVHLEDQCKKKCGHMPRKSLVTTEDWIEAITQVRQMLDTLGLYDVGIVMRTDAEDAHVISGDNDGRDQEFFLGLTNFASTKSIGQHRKGYEDAVRAHAQKDAENGILQPNQVEEAVKHAMDIFDPVVAYMVSEDGILRPYQSTIDYARSELKIDGADLEAVDALWKDLAGRKRLDTLVEEALVAQGEAAQMSVIEWRQYLQTIPRTAETDYIGIVKGKAEELGIVIHTRDEWLGFAKRASQVFEDGNTHLLWDHNATTIHEDGNHFWMIQSGLDMAIARNSYALRYGDNPWMEQKKAFILETMIWAMALDQAAVDLLIEKDFWGLLEEYGDEFKVDHAAAIEEILRNYLIQRRVVSDNTFQETRDALVQLGVSQETAVHLINTVSRPKANNTSPSFRWPFEEIGITTEKLQATIDSILKFQPSFRHVATRAEQIEKIWTGTHESLGLKAEPVLDVRRRMTDDEKKNFGTVQGVDSQKQFSTYKGEVRNHVMTQAYLEGIEDLKEEGLTDEEAVAKARRILLDIYDGGFIKNEMFSLSRLQELGYMMNNAFTANSQTFAGVVYDAYLISIGKGKGNLFTAHGGASDTQGRTVAESRIDIEQLTSGRTQELIDTLKGALRDSLSTEELRRVLVVAHAEIENVQKRIAEGIGEDQFSENESRLRSLVNEAIDQLMMHEDANSVSFKFGAVSWDNAEIRIEYPNREDFYPDGPVLGLKREIFMLKASERGLTRSETRRKRTVAALIEKAESKLAELQEDVEDDGATASSPLEGDASQVEIRQVLEQGEPLDMDRFTIVQDPRFAPVIAHLMERFGNGHSEIMDNRARRLAAINRGEFEPGKNDLDPDRPVTDPYGNTATVRDILTKKWKAKPGRKDTGISKLLEKAGAILTGNWTLPMAQSALKGRVITEKDRSLYNVVLDALQVELPAGFIAQLDKVELKKDDGAQVSLEEKITYIQSKLKAVQEELANTEKTIPVRLFTDLQDASKLHGGGVLEMAQNISDILNENITSIEKKTRSGVEVRPIPPADEWPTITVRAADMEMFSNHVFYKGQPVPEFITSLLYIVMMDSDRMEAIVYPKLESPEEVTWVLRIKNEAQAQLGIDRHIHGIFMNETIESAIMLKVMLWAGRFDFDLTNVGRWDKGAADMRTFFVWLKRVFGDLAKVGMSLIHMDSYVRQNIATANSVGMKGEGGMRTGMPSEGYKDAPADKRIITGIVLDVLYEWLLGYDYGWVASPSYTPLVQALYQMERDFEVVLEERPYDKALLADLLKFPEVALTRAELKQEVYEQLTFQAGARNTALAIAIDSRSDGSRSMFDGATSLKINNKLWPAVRAGVKITEGPDKDRIVDEDLIQELIEEVIAETMDRYRVFWDTEAESEVAIARYLLERSMVSQYPVWYIKQLMSEVINIRDEATAKRMIDEWLERYNAHQSELFEGDEIEFPAAASPVTEEGEQKEGELHGLQKRDFHVSGQRRDDDPAPIIDKITQIDPGSNTLSGLQERDRIVRRESDKLATSSPVGGIDLNSELLDLQIKRDGNGVPLPVFNQPPDLLMNIQGFLPVIINVTPVNVPLLLGLADIPDGDSEFGLNPDLDPSDRKARFEFDENEEVSMLN